jgi:hypothetical protein
MTSSGDKEFDARALGAVRKTKQLSAVNHLSDEEFEQVRVLNLVFRPQALKNQTATTNAPTSPKLPGGYRIDPIAVVTCQIHQKPI